MKIVIFCHSLVSDWNHGNAHFLRGIARALQKGGHQVVVFEPRGAWSRTHLEERYGHDFVDTFREHFPTLSSTQYDVAELDLDKALDAASLVLVHEWNEPELVKRIGVHRRSHDYRLLFHDTHHRAATDPQKMRRFDLRDYDGVLAFGQVLRDIYVERGWTERAWVWHEAADVDLFRPVPDVAVERDLVWIGNWGDDERTAELEEYLLTPAASLELTGTVHGVRYPADARQRVADAGLEFEGWIPNHDVPYAFARHRVTVHVPRQPYTRSLPGIPTIRVFEALACGIPLVSAPWSDQEGLFRPGKDYLIAEDSESMVIMLKAVLNEPDVAAGLARNGLETIRARHTCAHRAEELLTIYEELR